ncbi:MAG: hypothetical protein HYV26_16820 [Candidatus Hydrogenedentes bacterium]|nr:hypothetical protein [Candidatus Hydrogenedentota bacterium]MBI3118012.1 hypothetical protein [Candidatus Hydrogenedentota bacterium]
MAEQSPQNYANHRAVDRPIYAAALGVVLASVAALAGIYLLNATPAAAALLATAVMITAAVLLGLMLKMRRYSLCVQDRVIRLEMQLRLERVLPKDLHERAKALTLPQLIGLRFASDREMPELVEKVLAEKIATADAIKRLVKHWQADYLRV